MIELLDWARSHPLPARPWLILGKGPSFARVRETDVSPYNLVALNHVVRELKVHVAHFADLGALQDCADAVLANADWVLMPYWPHVDFKVDRPLPELIASVPVLAELDRRQRLVWYNLRTGTPVGDSPVINVGHFGSEAVVNILAVLGVKTIRTLGVDGGRIYDPTFRDLEGRTLLASGAASYDMQFVEINRTVKAHGIDFGPLVEPMRIFIGTDDSQRVAAHVLEYTIRKHASRPVEFVRLDSVDVPLPKDPRNRPRTGFSFKRFAIPALCGHRGRALYLDADMLVFGDIAALWSVPMGDRAVLCTSQPAPPDAWRDHEEFKPGRQMSVMLLDCGRLPWDAAEIIRGLDEDRYTYAQLMFDLCVVPPEQIGDTLPPEWNHLERFDPGATKLLHYTVVPTQPWKSDDNPLESLWLVQYAEAVAAGAIAREAVDEDIARGFVKPSLAACFALPRTGRAAAAPAGGPTADLEMLSLRGALLVAEARIADLQGDVRNLRRAMSHMRGSWTWRIGMAATQPARLAADAIRRVRARPTAPAVQATRQTVTSAQLPTLYREMHASGQFAGVAWKSVFDAFATAVPDLERRTTLDFGCGPRGGLAEQLPGRVISYDPHVDAYASPPWDRAFDVVFSSDVLEHLLPEDVEAFAANVRGALPEFIFLNISTRAAHKTFSNGVNVHVTVRPTQWWLDTLSRSWKTEYEGRLLQEDFESCTLLFERRPGVRS